MDCGGEEVKRASGSDSHPAGRSTWECRKRRKMESKIQGGQQLDTSHYYAGNLDPLQDSKEQGPQAGAL